MTTPASFRSRLDAVLRTVDVRQVQQFLIAEGQWDADTPANPELAMWIMIAGSPGLRHLHMQARGWLVSHGHEEEALALLAREKKPAPRPGQGKRPPQKNSQPQRRSNSQ